MSGRLTRIEQRCIEVHRLLEATGWSGRTFPVKAFRALVSRRYGVPVSPVYFRTGAALGLWCVETETRARGLLILPRETGQPGEFALPIPGMERVRAPPAAVWE